MKLNFVPPLQHFALAEIAVSLCKNLGIKALLVETRSIDFCESLGRRKSRHPLHSNDEHPAPCHGAAAALLKRIAGMISDMISPLNLGTSNEMKILSFIPRIMIEIDKWGKDHSEVLPAGYDAHVHFCWKSLGTIDRKRTAENLLRRGKLSVINQFCLAYMYCVYNPFSFIFGSIYTSHEDYRILKCIESSLNYWISNLDNLLSRSCSFPNSLHATNVSVLQHFYSECQSEDEKRILLNVVLDKHWKNPDLVRFCVSKLCQNGNEELTSRQCLNILRCFLNWPLNCLFLDALECLLVKLDLVELSYLLYDFIQIIITYQYEAIDYINLLKEVWEKIPSCHKYSLLNNYEFLYISIPLEDVFSGLWTPKLYHP